MLNTLAMFGGQDMIIVLVAILILFGGKKIPELMRGVGQGVGELKKGMEEGQRQVRDAIHHDDVTPVAPVAPTPVASVPVAPTATSTPNNPPA